MASLPGLCATLARFEPAERRPLTNGRNTVLRPQRVTIRMPRAAGNHGEDEQDLAAGR